MAKLAQEPSWAHRCSPARVEMTCSSIAPGHGSPEGWGQASSEAIHLYQWIYYSATNCSKFIGKDEWPPNSPDVNPLDYHVRSYARTSHFNPSWRTSMSSKRFCSWYGTTCHSYIKFPEKTSGLCESWWWTLRTHTKMKYLWNFSICNNSQCFLTMKITNCYWLFHAKLKIWRKIFI